MRAWVIRRLVLDDVANSEISKASENIEARSPQKADDFLSEVRVALRAVQDFPFARSVRATDNGMESRRIKVARFPFLLCYFVFPSVDSNTGEPLDIIYILACVHEKQAEPNWGVRDPFRLPS